MACALIPLYFPTLGDDAIDTKLSLCALLSHGRHRSLLNAKSMKFSPFHEILHGFGWQLSTKLFANIFTLSLIPDFIPVHPQHSANKKLLLWVWLLAHRSQPSFPAVFMRWNGIKKVFAIHGPAELLVERAEGGNCVGDCSGVDSQFCWPKCQLQMEKLFFRTNAESWIAVFAVSIKNSGTLVFFKIVDLFFKQ